MAPVAGDSPLWWFATGQSSEFGSNHEQIPALVALQQRQPPPPGTVWRIGVTGGQTDCFIRGGMGSLS
jgi:hypothetical protein